MEAVQRNIERKTQDKRQRATDLDRLRHSAAQIMATAVLRLWLEANLDLGPCAADGFYYDFGLLNHHFTPEDFPKIEAEMKRIANENLPFVRTEKTRGEAKTFRETHG